MSNSALPSVSTWADSTIIYRQADSIRMGAAPDVQDLVGHIQTAQSERNEKAQTAWQIVSALTADNVLEQNRKDVLLIYTQTIGQGIWQLNAAQSATITGIAYQCPEEGGSTVYLAQVIYQLIGSKNFDDDELCGGGERSDNARVSIASTPGFELMPNPATNTVAIVGLQTQKGQDVRITLSDASGRAMLEKQISETQDVIQLSLEGLLPGLYFCHVNTGDGGVATRKLVISR